MEYKFRLGASAAAVGRLAAGSSITVATLMCIPDAISLSATSASAFAWAVRLVGTWLTTAILWFLGFWLMIVAMQQVGGSILLGDQGIRLWRAGKPVKWSDVVALTVEPQKMFAATFCLPGDTYRLTLYTRKPNAGLVPHNIPSFLFDPGQFRALVNYAAAEVFSHKPANVRVCLYSPDSYESLKNAAYRSIKISRILSVIIAVGLIMFLGRRSMENYEFNLGSKAFRKADYATAAAHYRRAVEIDPVFAIAWDQLARSEFRTGKLQEAEQHWMCALKYRPDLIESKIGLSNIYMRRGEYERAKEILEHCLRLQPYHDAARLNLQVLHRVWNPTQ